MKIVVDANLFASGLIKPNSNPGRILDLIRENQVEIILSPSIIREIKRILLYPKIQKYHHRTSQEIDTYFQDIIIFAWMVEGNEPVNIIEADPTDNKYLAAPVEGEANYIVSGDHHLLNLKKYQKIEIINANTFIGRWKKDDKKDK